MIKKLLNVLALMLAIGMGLTGCGGRLRYPTYYTLNLPAPPDPPAPSCTEARPRKSVSTSTTAGRQIRGYL
jgi:hypothetical protein